MFLDNLNIFFLFVDAEDFEPEDFKNKPSDRWEGEDEDDVKVCTDRLMNNEEICVINLVIRWIWQWNDAEYWMKIILYEFNLTEIYVIWRKKCTTCVKLENSCWIKLWIRVHFVIALYCGLVVQHTVLNELRQTVIFGKARV